MTTRPTPLALVFGGLADARFPAIREAVGDFPALDHFLLAEAVVELLQELRPDDGIGEAMDDFVAFTHAAYCAWAAGGRRRHCDEAATTALCAPGRLPLAPLPTVVEYIQVAPRRIWAQLGPDEPHEPLDGWFALPVDDRLRVVACFGVHPERPGLSVVAVEGGAPGPMAREDGTPLFAPTMPGGEAAGLHALAAPEELLLLAWRAGRFGEER